MELLRIIGRKCDAIFFIGLEIGAIFDSFDCVGESVKAIQDRKLKFAKIVHGFLRAFFRSLKSFDIFFMAGICIFYCIIRIFREGNASNSR